MTRNQFDVDPGVRDGVEDFLVSLGIETPKLCFADIGQARVTLIVSDAHNAWTGPRNVSPAGGMWGMGAKGTTQLVSYGHSAAQRWRMVAVVCPLFGNLIEQYQTRADAADRLARRLVREMGSL